MKKTMSKQRYIINAISVFVVILIAWIAITELGLVKPVILPKPIDVAKYIYEAFRYNNLNLQNV